MFSCRRYVYVENRVRPRVHEKRDFPLLNRQLRSPRVVLRGVTTVKTGGFNPNNTVGREERDGMVELNTPNRQSCRLNALLNVESERVPSDLRYSELGASR